MHNKDLSAKLQNIISQEKWLMDILRTVRDLQLPDWYLAAGVIRNTAWDVLHGYKKRTPLNDIDIVYFDSRKKFQEKEIEKKLKKIYPQYSWEVVNQAFVHKTYAYKLPVKNSCEAIAHFIEVPTCVGVRLEKDDSLTVCAPHGLRDLFSFRVVPIPVSGNLKTYRERMKKKQWKKIWPKLYISSLS